MTVFWLTKRTGTYADALAACGLAGLLTVADADSVTIRDEGWGYAVEAAKGITDLKLGALHADPGYPYVLLPRKDGKVDANAPTMHTIDYADERDRLKNYREQRELLRKARGRLTEDDEAQLKQIAPRDGWFLYQNFNVLQAFGGYNGLHADIRRSDPQKFTEAVADKLRALETQGDPADVNTAFAPNVSAVQTFNPSVGKGVNRPKPNGTGAAGLPPVFVDWFEEWLRYIGMGRSAYSLAVGKDIKVMVIAPADADASLLTDLWHELVTMRTPWSSVTVDILYSLGFARFLIVRSGLTAEATVGSVLDLMGRCPSDVVAGLQTAYFTSLGNARALTNTSFIGLPGWFAVTAESASVWIDIIEEHRRVIRGLDEEKTEELRLLQLYRDFISSRAAGLTPFLRMLSGYAAHLLRAREQRNRRVSPSQFTVPLLRRLITEMEPQYGPIFDNEGFQNIATAIRKSTVTEQYWKTKSKQQYEIRYGLFQDLERKAHFKSEFISGLGDFIREYDAENAKMEERFAKNGKPSKSLRHRKRVTIQDIASLVVLLDEFDKTGKAEVVARLLLAYASARDPGEPDAPTAEQAGDDGDLTAGSDSADETA
jgi:hypothetical protein